VVRRSVRSIERGGGGRQRTETAGAGGGRASRGGALRGVSGTLTRMPRLESMGWSGEKGNGLGPGKQCRVAVVN
jgi:hypothetical protein